MDRGAQARLAATSSPLAALGASGSVSGGEVFAVWRMAHGPGPLPPLGGSELSRALYVHADATSEVRVGSDG